MVLSHYILAAGGQGGGGQPGEGGGGGGLGVGWGLPSPRAPSRGASNSGGDFHKYNYPQSGNGRFLAYIPP